MLRRGWRPVLLILLLLVSGIAGLRNVRNEWSDADTAGRKVATGLELSHALAAWVALAGLGAKRAFAFRAAYAWCALITATAGVAAAFWGEAGLFAALAAGLATFVVCAFAIWLGLRRPDDAPAREPA